ncbi:hypothetical protein BKH46_04840 [Helicobacter sp. 12S02634-8]|uniref:hypothetical protein n=1 Tax=Helicobacter sp. 12S02634-8 TaxID=1476199 RepID=UPI000BA7D220|nr:hypothetical protein [Helicobacter sp. 12S02634-8]PAF47050.1 hypothetical protein BKH46_04840 [Helicobacter sp. 12S02634-8]
MHHAKPIYLTQFLPQIQLLKSQKPFYTNLYSYTPSAYLAKSTPSSLLLLKEERQLVRVYFCTHNLCELESLITELTHTKPLCIEILQKQPTITLHSLKPHALYLHLRKTLQPTPTLEKSPPMFATISPKTLRKLLLKDFSPITDHLPSIQTLQSHYQAGHILSVRSSSMIESYLLFTHTGKSAYLNFIANHANKQSLLRLWKMFYQKLNTLEVKFLHLWCDTTNTKALNMYHKENFSADGLKNYIYIKSSQVSGGGGINNPDYTPIFPIKVA